ncbi:MAG: class I SAM-dependent methyltransferase [bacterium]|nr:class I SAM-dependent methyltransferase [bacterium]
MPQRDVWEGEYANSKLVTKGEKPQSSVVRFFKSLRKEKIVLDGLDVLDLGCGTGRNALYCAQEGAQVVGIEISTNALAIAQERAKTDGVDIRYIHGDIGAPLRFPDETFDIILDVTSSNSLSGAERTIYLKESARVLKTTGRMFVRALCKDGDVNARKLLKSHPGKEQDTYIMPDLGLVERVFSREDFLATYKPYFDVYFLEKETHYSLFDGIRYKRNYWIGYLKR